MGTVKINIGAPSMTGISAHQKLSDALAGVTFPATVQLENFLNRKLVLPEIKVGLASFDTPGSKAETSVNSLDELLRSVSSLEQVATSHRSALAVSMEVSWQDLVDKAKPKPAKPTATVVEPATDAVGSDPTTPVTGA